MSNTRRTDIRSVIFPQYLGFVLVLILILPKFCSLGYIAGFTDSEVNSRPDLYDVYVNLADSEITVSPVVKGWLLFLFWIYSPFIPELIVIAEPRCPSRC